MDRSQLSELHYIAPIQNVPSILQQGLLSHHRAQRVVHRSVAMEGIQERRAKVRVPAGRPLHQYVNLYINGRNPMMFTVLKEASVDEMCLLRVSTTVLDIEGAVIADCNASSDYVLFAKAPRGLERIDRSTVFAQYWTHPNPIDQLRHKSAMCAEVLVPDVVEAGHILGAYVGSSVARRELSSVAPSLPVILNPYFFFG